MQRRKYPKVCITLQTDEYIITQFGGLNSKKNDILQKFRTCTRPYNSISVIVRCLSSTRDMELPQKYAARGRHGCFTSHVLTILFCTDA